MYRKFYRLQEPWHQAHTAKVSRGLRLWDKIPFEIVSLRLVCQISKESAYCIFTAKRQHGPWDVPIWVLEPFEKMDSLVVRIGRIASLILMICDCLKSLKMEP